MDGQLSLTRWIESLSFNIAQLHKNRRDCCCGLKILHCVYLIYCLFTKCNINLMSAVVMKAKMIMDSWPNSRSTIIHRVWDSIKVAKTRMQLTPVHRFVHHFVILPLFLNHLFAFTLLFPNA